MEEDFAQDLEIDLAGEEEAEEIEEDAQFLDRFVGCHRVLAVSQLDGLGHFAYVGTLESKLPSLLLGTGEKLEQLNALSSILQGEIWLLHDYCKMLYGQRFGELESLVTDPLKYVEVISIIEKDVQATPEAFEEEAKLSKEQILVLMMSMKTSLQQGRMLTEKDRAIVLEARDIMLTIASILKEVREYVVQRVSNIAPNLSALVGPEITSLLLAHSGGVRELSQVPSCNLASIGKNKHLAHELHTSLTGVRQEGYIYRSRLVQEQPHQYHKQTLRMVCAKVALAARVDAGIRSSQDSSSALGDRWRLEISLKLQKQQEAATNAVVKPLPIPKDEPKKKRSGRKFRKYKQQFQLSHLRQLQNRVEFGKQEQTMLDAYGEEVGLGMVNSSLQSATGVGAVTKRGVNNSAKLTKTMKKRIEEANDQTRDYLASLESP